MNKTFKRIIYVVHLSLFVLVLGGLLLPVLSGGDVILNETGQSILDLCSVMFRYVNMYCINCIMY